VMMEGLLPLMRVKLTAQELAQDSISIGQVNANVEIRSRSLLRMKSAMMEMLPMETDVTLTVK